VQKESNGGSPVTLAQRVIVTDVVLREAGNAVQEIADDVLAHALVSRGACLQFVKISLSSFSNALFLLPRDSTGTSKPNRVISGITKSEVSECVDRLLSTMD
jgi:hypothetical protein